MQAFAALLDALSFQPARNAKLRLIETYLRETPADYRADDDVGRIVQSQYDP